MTIRKIQMKPEGANDYGDILHPETSADMVQLASPNFTADNVEGAMNELFTNVSNGKSSIATAITGKGIATSSGATFGTMATNIGKIVTDPSGDATATAPHILAPYTAYSKKAKLTGTMPNNGARSGTITTQNGQIVIPAGYTSGGTIEATFGNLSAENVKSGVNIGGIVGNAVPQATGMDKVVPINFSYVNSNQSDIGVIYETIHNGASLRDLNYIHFVSYSSSVQIDYGHRPSIIMEERGYGGSSFIVHGYNIASSYYNEYYHISISKVTPTKYLLIKLYREGYYANMTLDHIYIDSSKFDFTRPLFEYRLNTGSHENVNSFCKTRIIY